MLRRAVALMGAAAATTTVLVAGAPVASAAGGPRGDVTVAVQNQSAHRLSVRGWAYDSRDRSRTIGVRIYAGGVYLGRAIANLPNHRFQHTFTVTRKVASVQAKSFGIGRTKTALSGQAVKQYTPPSGSQIVSIAKRYVGKARYVDGGASPRRGFDCSGFTKYVYGVAKVATLPHNTNSQAAMRGMRKVSAAAARPGDLVFYHGGGGIFHVAIYAGGHKQVAAATPRDGIVYQNIWSSNVTYGHYVG
ncbi:C40 family peptidase [Jatrophihabitans fulvus]